MILSIFSSLFEMIIGENVNYPEYRESIFDSVGLFSLFIAVGICLIFYLAFGRNWHIWYTKWHWTITLLIATLIGFIFAFMQAKNELGAMDSYLIRFALFNALYSAIYFIAFSFLFKNFSIYSKRTPI